MIDERVIGSPFSTSATLPHRLGSLAGPARAMSETVRFSVNGKPREIEVRAGESAAEVLRDRLGLTGAKLVCGEGVCGACTVLLEGVPVTSCLLPATALEDRALTTVEGLGPDLHPVQRAFIAHDALQCGYCTPGFVVEAIAFHDRWRRERGSDEPAREDVALALAGHLCRCGAYVGILAAVRDACAGRFDAGDSSGPRLEAREKVTGEAVYAADVRHEGQLEGAILRSPHPHARVISVDLDPARAFPGVGAAVELLGQERLVRYVGQEVAAVAATDRHTAEQALALVRVRYEPLPAAIGAEAARREGAAAVYGGLRKRPPSSAEGPPAPARWHGNLRGPVGAFSQRARRARRLVAEARERGDPLLVEGSWRTAPQVHTALEPHACAARWDGERLHVHVSTQAVGRLAKQIAERFELEEEQVHLVAEHVGGGFGAKQNLTPETVAAIELARVARAPVRVALDRGEEISVAGYRPSAEIELALLASDTGGPRALQVRAYGDAGVGVGSQIAALCRMVYPAPAKDLPGLRRRQPHAAGPALPGSQRAAVLLGARAGGGRGSAPARGGSDRAAAALGSAPAAPAALRLGRVASALARPSRDRFSSRDASGAGWGWPRRTGSTSTSWAARSRWASNTGGSSWPPACRTSARAAVACWRGRSLVPLTSTRPRWRCGSVTRGS